MTKKKTESQVESATTEAPAPSPKKGVVEQWMDDHKGDLKKDTITIVRKFCRDLKYTWRPVQSELHKLGHDIETTLDFVHKKNTGDK